ncbi:MAG: murein L,D-transpeptidase [Hyphomicrobiales bacterium]|nr:murein L,D-transpeptidase [Hyphomicrobiales bacterium]MDE2113920.1 murein L,D-transpeptidase [Hyphomicrobiales bacterium]
MLPNRFWAAIRALGGLWGRLAILMFLGVGLAACQQQSVSDSRAYAAISPETLALMKAKGTTPEAPMMIRAFKKESTFEIWKMTDSGEYALLKSYPMCRWSGQLGPKKREGDRQVPEGFYQITPGQMNPHSHYYLSFNVGYPNAYDRAWGHSGGSIMVHGICSSAGCFSMTNKQIGEIYSIAREAFAGGQKAIEMQTFPFHMTPKNLAKFRLDPNMPFWKELKKGDDYFKVAKVPPLVGVCGRKYVFNKQPANPKDKMEASAACPKLVGDPQVEAAAQALEQSDDIAVAKYVAAGTPAVREVYADGGQNPVFAGIYNDVSRPEALVSGPQEVAIGTSAPKAGKAKAEVKLAEVKSAGDTRKVMAKKAVPQPVAVAAVAPAPVSTVAKSTEVAAASQPSRPFYAKLFNWGRPEPKVEAVQPLNIAPTLAVEPDAAQPSASVPLPPVRSAHLTHHKAKAKKTQALLMPSPPAGAVALASADQN